MIHRSFAWPSLRRGGPLFAVAFLTVALFAPPRVPAAGLSRSADAPLASPTKPTWQQMVSGEHSFKDLGTDFYAEVAVRRNPTMKLAFFRKDVARALGLDFPSDPAQLERFLVNLFGLEIDPTGLSPRKWFATHYLDSDHKGPGQAVGDGRALWSGELVLTDPDGRRRYLDVVIKGVGATPFAWTENDSHRDGNQQTWEMVVSGIASTAAQANQFDSTVDLAGFTKVVDGKVVSQTVRIGVQTRPAHPEYFKDNAAQFNRIMDYIVRRDLGLGLEQKVDFALKKKFLVQFARGAGEEAARYFDLQVVQESPTLGNKTTTGGSIDMSLVTFLDAYHTDLKFLYGSANVSEQNYDMEHYVQTWLDRMEEASYLTPTQRQHLENYLFNEYGYAYSRSLGPLTLLRLGLSPQQVRRVSAGARNELVTAYDELVRLKSPETIQLNRWNETLHPALIDPRRVLSLTLKTLQATPDVRALTSAGSELFRVERAWATSHLKADARAKDRYLNAVRRVLADLGWTRIPQEAIERAEIYSSPRRLEIQGWTFWRKFAEPIVKSIDSRDYDYTQIDAKMEAAAASLVDPHLPRRPRLSVRGLDCTGALTSEP